MDRYDPILFDLDGTLTDPGVGIRNSVAYALEKFGILVEHILDLNCFIGPPLQESFQRFYSFSKEQAEQAVVYYREYYQTRGMLENLVYGGIPEMLIQLKAHGKTLLVATSKPEVYARQILDHFVLTQYFDYIAGGNLDGTRCQKDEVIAYALEQCPPYASTKPLMVGDRKHDIIGAKRIGIDSIGVLFGYGSTEELADAGAMKLIGTVEELTQILLSI